MSILDVLTKHADSFRQKTGVTSKLTIPEMTDLMTSLKWGQYNLLKGTSNQYQNADILATKNWASAAAIKDNNSNFTDLGSLKGKSVTYSAELINDTSSEIDIEIVQYGEGDVWLTSKHSGVSLVNKGDNGFLTVCDLVRPDAKYICLHTYVYHIPYTGNIKVKNERLYKGTVPGVWTPNPADIVGGNAV